MYKFHKQQYLIKKKCEIDGKTNLYSNRNYCDLKIF